MVQSKRVNIGEQVPEASNNHRGGAHEMRYLCEGPCKVMKIKQEKADRSMKKRYNNKNMWGFGSDGYLYDFAKRSQEKRLPMDDMWGFGSDGYLYDFTKRSQEKRSPMDDM